MPSAQLFHGKVIVRKSSYVRRFEEKRVCLRYRPLKAPKTERVLWYTGEDGKSDHGYGCTKAEYDSFDVPDTTEAERQCDIDNWSRAISEEIRTNWGKF